VSDILTKDELAQLLRMSKRQVDTLCETRTRQRQTHPLPVFKINGNVRFSRTAVEKWLEQLQEAA